MNLTQPETMPVSIEEPALIIPEHTMHARHKRGRNSTSAFGLKVSNTANEVPYGSYQSFNNAQNKKKPVFVLSTLNQGTITHSHERPNHTRDSIQEIFSQNFTSMQHSSDNYYSTDGGLKNPTRSVHKTEAIYSHFSYH